MGDVGGRGWTMSADVDHSTAPAPAETPDACPALRAGGARPGDGRLHDRHHRVRDDGLLPQIAEGVGVSIPQAGHIISAYAVGVVIGAPVLAFLGARLPRRGLLVALMVAYAVGNAASAVATSYELLTLARVRDGLPPRRLLRRRVAGGGLACAPGPQGPRRRHGDAGSVGRQRGRRARGDLAGPAPRLALGLLGGRRTRAAHGRPRPRLRALVPRRRRGHRAARAARRSASRRCG